MAWLIVSLLMLIAILLAANLLMLSAQSSSKQTDPEGNINEFWQDMLASGKPIVGGIKRL